MSAPPVPPRPYETTLNVPPPPPLPPVPPALKKEAEVYDTPSQYELVESPPHFENPMIAPRPHRLDPSIPTNMARTLDDQLQQHAQSPSINFAPGFALPTPGPPQSASSWSPWGASSSYSQPTAADVTQSLANLSMAPTLPISIAPPAQPPPTAPNPYGSSPPRQQQKQSSPPPSSIPSLTAPLPVLSQLQSASAIVQGPTHDPALKVAWCRDVFFLVECALPNPAPSTDPVVGPITIPNPDLAKLAHAAVPLCLSIASSFTPAPGAKMPAYVAEAIAMRAALASTGAYPEFVRHNPRQAFRDFEAAARGGYAAAWFRLGRDYENFNDHAHAKECFERGVKLGVESCLYRMGMAHLLGQLSLPSNPPLALPLLHRAATLATLDCPQPAYVYALLLLSEFTQLTVPPALFSPFIPPGSSPTLEARKHLERAAYLHFPAAQYKLGHAYEFAEAPFPFDPLLSVQYYSLASQQGEVEADMALSKWFLCGSGGAALGASPYGPGSGQGGFEKDEGLALTFAQKAARKGLPSAEFAMGYYAEVGVGRPKDLRSALAWYAKAAEHGNDDARERLGALQPNGPGRGEGDVDGGKALSRQEHESITQQKLVRRRTLAAQKAETQPLSPPWEGRTFPTLSQAQAQAQQSQGQNQSQNAQGGMGVGGMGGIAGRRREDGRLVVEVIRKNSMAHGYNPSSSSSYPTSSSSYPTSSSSAPSGSGGGGGGGKLAALREQSPSRSGGRHRYDSESGHSSPQRIGSPARGRRTESPSRVGANASYSSSSSYGASNPSSYAASGSSPGRHGGVGPSVNAPPTPTTPTGHSSRPTGGRAPSPGRPVGGRAQSPGRLGRMRLNLDDPPVPDQSSSYPSSSYPGGQGQGGGPGTGTPMTSMSMTPLRPPQTAGAGGAGGKPQTFAEMGFHGTKVEDEKCVVM
ncbi:unnamed protein product [Cyclocybe aegerita]|uniref:HCP-like protein n=1 Tax=Cyclocybe aegerita TaxID=1973307 RepID=A0A8S0W4D7_CYCAE|nr:unnamed protein product [Cyclocybe aegerita]